MNKTRIILLGSVVAAAMIFGGVVGGTVLARSTLVPASAALTAASPSPSFKSNESAAHESGESASREAAENNGTFRPGGAGGFFNGHPCGGHSNEDATHEKSESSAVEAAENAACPATTSPSPSA